MKRTTCWGQALKSARPHPHQILLHVFTHRYMYVCMYVCINVCMVVCMYGCMVVCMYTHKWLTPSPPSISDTQKCIQERASLIRGVGSRIRKQIDSRTRLQETLSQIQHVIVISDMCSFYIHEREGVGVWVCGCVCVCVIPCAIHVCKGKNKANVFFPDSTPPAWTACLSVT